MAELFSLPNQQQPDGWDWRKAEDEVCSKVSPACGSSVQLSAPNSKGRAPPALLESKNSSADSQQSWSCISGCCCLWELVEELSDNIMSTKHHLVVMAPGLPARPECHLPAQSTAWLCQHHCLAVPSSLPNFPQLFSRLCPAHCQAMPRSPPGSFPGLAQLTTARSQNTAPEPTPRMLFFSLQTEHSEKIQQNWFLQP